MYKGEKVDSPGFTIWLQGFFMRSGQISSRLVGLFTASALLAGVAAAQTSTQTSPHSGPVSLWYRQPAAQWREALPVGNGRLGAMVFGGANSIEPNGDSQDDAANRPIADGSHTRPQDEHLQLNEDTVWQGDRANRLNPKAGTAFPEVRRLLLAGKVGEAEALVGSAMIAIPAGLPSYSTLSDLYLRSSSTAPVTDYRRQLDLATGVVRVTYTCEGVHYVREVFASAPDHVLVVHLSADRPGSISFTATIDRPYDFTASAIAPNRLVLLPGPDHKGAIHFRAEAEVLPEGGTIKAGTDRISIAGANSVTLLLAAATDFQGGPFPGGDPAIATAGSLAAASGKTYASLKQTATDDNSRFFDRVKLRIGPSDISLDRLATDERLRRASAGADDPGLAALYFQFGRYLLIASSRPGGLPANLQGLWAAGIENPWGSKYTVNINAEMNYWLAETGNLSEMHQPLFDLLDMIRNPSTGTGVEVARKYYGAAGFVAHHNTDIWGDAVPIDGYPWGMWPMGAAWLSLDQFDHYAFTGDRGFLAARAYPNLRASVQFFLDYLTPDAQGHLVTGPSLSPENSYLLPDGSSHSLVMGPTMDIEIVRALFNAFRRASTVLDRDSALRDRVQADLAKLPPFKVGHFGQLQEWPEDYAEAEPGHRHISHLWALFPGDQISPRTTPELARAARVTLERRLAAGGGQTGWSRAWVMNYWARLQEGDKAYQSLQVLLSQSTYPNLFDDCTPGPVFQIDGNLGGAAGIANLLLQSQSDAQSTELDLLPALPKAWPEGEFSGLRARGGVVLDLKWASSRAISATLHATINNPLTVRAPRGQSITGIVNRSGNVILFTRDQDPESVRFTAHRGETYILHFK